MNLSGNRIQLLQSMPVFGGITAPTLEFLLPRTREVRREAGEYFFREGEPGESMYVLEEGTVDVIRHWQGEEFVLRSLGAGDSFGEMALIDLFPRSACVQAMERALALELTSDALFEVYGHDPEQFMLMQMNVAREISRRLRVADERMFHMQVSRTKPDESYDFSTL